MKISPASREKKKGRMLAQWHGQGCGREEGAGIEGEAISSFNLEKKLDVLT